MPDATALAGLRRLVLHANRLLAAASTDPNAGNWSLDERIETWHAVLLGREVLQLVADCLPEHPDPEPGVADVLAALRTHLQADIREDGGADDFADECRDLVARIDRVTGAAT